MALFNDPDERKTAVFAIAAGLFIFSRESQTVGDASLTTAMVDPNEAIDKAELFVQAAEQRLGDG